MDMKRFFLYAIVIAALALAGCGGNGGGGGNGGDDDMMMPTTPTAHDVTVPMLPTGYNDNPAGEFTVAAGATHDNGDVTYSCPAGGAACDIEVMDDGTVTSTGGAATAARSAASMAQQTADEEAAEAARLAAIAAATKAAGTKRTAIAAEAAQTTDAGLGGTARTDADGSTTEVTDDVYGLEISRDRDGTEIKITDPSLAGMDDPKFTQAMDLGGGTTMHVRTMDADDDGDVMEEVVVVTTDIEAPKATMFTRVANQKLNENPATTSGMDYRSLRVITTNALDTSGVGDDGTGSPIINALTFMNIRGPAAAASGGVQTITYMDDAATADVNERRFTGTYNGAPGTYVCTGADACTATVNDKGAVTAMAGAVWTFTPDAGATSDVADADYLHYGFWLKRTTDSDGVLTYNEVETFAGSSVAASTGSELDAVTGSATYSGGATGVYVHNVVNSDGTEASATSGHFTATANLTAYFGQTLDDTATNASEAGQLAPNLLNTITGTISDFMLSGGEENGWSVALRGTRGDGTPTSGSNTFTGTASGGVAGSPGTLSGTYHGLTPETTSTTDGATRVAPGAVVGEFSSVFSNGSVAGAFGARKQ